MTTTDYISFINYFKNNIKNNNNACDLKALEYIKFNNSSSSISDSNNESLSFKQVDRYSDNLSLLLNRILKLEQQHNHSQQAIVVGVYMNHSFELILSILSIFKLNLIYLPLDPSYPIDRLLYMIENSDCKYIITTKSFHHCCNNLSSQQQQQQSLTSINNSNNNNFHIICIDCYRQEIYNDSSSFKEIENKKQDSAYLIYTSGSTGKPKGVLVSHLGIVDFLLHQITTFGFKSAHTRLFQSLPICFDASLSEIGTSLLGLCTLVIPFTPEDGNLIRGSSDNFINTLCRESITSAMISPSFLSQLSVQSYDLKQPPLESIVIGGEVCPLHVLVEWRKRLDIVNVYGPTEATVCTTTLQIKRSLVTNDTDDLVSLGSVVPNLHLYLLDNNMELIKENGAEGELYIGGNGVAKEYFKAPELTSKSFVDNPFLADGSKMFKTGDWGKMLDFHSNRIQFKGRIDNQIKMAGSRIELDEIARVLEQHNEIQRAVVDVKTVSDEKVIVAYVILKQLSCKITIPETNTSNTLLSRQLKDFLKKSLPTYMIPNHFVSMNSFPQNSNEKIDKSKLPLPVIATTLDQDQYGVNILFNDLTSREKLMELLKKVIENILLCPIGSSDDLIYSYGLTSINCMRIIQSCKSNYGINLSVFQIYTKRSIDCIVDDIILQSKSSNNNNDKHFEKSIIDLIQFTKSFQYDKKTVLNSNNSKRNNNDVGKSILITGSTGFLGSSITNSLLEKLNDSNFYLLVRDVDKARLKFKSSNNIKFIKGDISDNLFGMDREQWSQLTNNITHVIHLAAHVDLTLPFDQIVGSNVKSMYQMLNFIQQSPNFIQFDYVSTLSTILSDSFVWKSDSIVNLTAPINKSEKDVIYGGYAQTKWISEFILEEFKNNNPDSNIQINIHRPAMICNSIVENIVFNNSDNTNTSRVGHQNYLDKFIQSCMKMKSFPNLPKSIETDVTDIKLFTFEFIKNINASYNSNNNNNNNSSNSINSIQYYAYHDKSISLIELFKDQTNYTMVSVQEWISSIDHNSPFYPFLFLLNPNNLDIFERILFPGNKLKLN
ncbi:hypothetical protein CYY_003408 [Polysphondylium violaceum]|uniref:Carrier domain-containing protein n=1 Tax=Polysphondylium violaceum TaxID=133409 RepID=A0A8J4PZR1_9MYCE|nr:hypothetical protein CYY_003408 [Polysphondylium violaceum]